MLKEERFDIEASQEEVMITRKMRGEIIRVIVNYLEDVDMMSVLRIETVTGETILNVQGNKNAIYYPRNTNIQHQKYSEKTFSAYGEATERWVVFGPLIIGFSNAAKKPGKVNIRILVNE